MTEPRALAACPGKDNLARQVAHPIVDRQCELSSHATWHRVSACVSSIACSTCLASVLLKHLRASSSSTCCCARRALMCALLVQMPVLNEGIRNFYDKSSGLWERMWGEHMHHGYYDPRSAVKVSKEQAQLDMIDNVLEFAGVTSAERMVDVGCGIGGSSRCAAQC